MKVVKIDNVFNYNSACKILWKNFIDVAEVKTTGIRYMFYNHDGIKVADYNERIQVLKVYNYNTKSDLNGKILMFH